MDPAKASPHNCGCEKKYSILVADCIVIKNVIVFAVSKVPFSPFLETSIILVVFVVVDEYYRYCSDPDAYYNECNDDEVNGFHVS